MMHWFGAPQTKGLTPGSDAYKCYVYGTMAKRMKGRK